MHHEEFRDDKMRDATKYLNAFQDMDQIFKKCMKKIVKIDIDEFDYVSSLLG